MADATLWNHLQSIIPNNSTPIVQAAINAIGQLPKTRIWKPTLHHWYEAHKIIDWGIPFALTEGLTSLEPLRRKVGNSIVTTGEPNPNDLAEADLAALMLICKAQQVERIKEREARTPDFHVQWDDKQIVEVEVTRADRKPAHKERCKIADNICERIYTANKLWDIELYIADKLSNDEVQHLLEAANTIQPGTHVNNPGRWWLYAEIPNRPPGQLDFTRFSRILSGWPLETVAGGFSIRVYPDTLESVTPNPLVYVGFGVPVAGYINPIEHKAMRIQGSKTTTFIIAFDIRRFSNGYEEVQNMLPVYLEAWPSVSAILLFQRESDTGGFGWTWELHVNPYAQFPLPTTVLQHFPTQRQRYSIYWNYTLSE